MTADARVTAWLDRLEGLHTAATPGPWQHDPSEPDTVWGGDDGVVTPIVATTRAPLNAAGVHHAEADAAAIVAEHNNFGALLALARGVTTLHVPWYEVNGVRHDNTVTVGCEQYDGCDGTADRWCAESDGDGHEVLACAECRCVVDYDLQGFLLWPCPTARLLADAAPDTGEETA